MKRLMKKALLALQNEPEHTIAIHCTTCGLTTNVLSVGWEHGLISRHYEYELRYISRLDAKMLTQREASDDDRE